MSDQTVFRNLGDQLMCVRQAALDDRPHPKLVEVEQRADEQYAIERRASIAPAGGSEMVPSDGGFLVEPTFTRRILERMYATGQIFKRCLGLPITIGSSLKIPQFSETSRATGSRLGGVQVYSQNEAESLQVIQSGVYSQKPTFSLLNLVAKKLTGLLYLTGELSRDTAAFDTWANYAFSQELMFTLENQIINGTGAGQCQGILNANALVTVPKETGQPKASVKGANVINMTSRLWAPSRPNAIWLYNQQNLESLGTLSLVTGSAQVLLWHFSENEDEPDTLCGIPAYPSEYCQVPGTPGDLLLLDLSRYVVATRETRADVSLHVLFLTDQEAFRFVWRVDGAPIDQAALQPLYATQASPPDFFTSPFVALALRS